MHKGSGALGAERPFISTDTRSSTSSTCRSARKEEDKIKYLLIALEMWMFGRKKPGNAAFY